MAIEKRLEDQILYELVLDELEVGIKIKGLWGKAYANSEGDNNKVEPLYMQYRVQSIKDILTAMKIEYEGLSKEKISDYINQPEDKISNKLDRTEQEQSHDDTMETKSTTPIQTENTKVESESERYYYMIGIFSIIGFFSIICILAFSKP